MSTKQVGTVYLSPVFVRGQRVLKPYLGNTWDVGRKHLTTSRHNYATIQKNRQGNK